MTQPPTSAVTSIAPIAGGVVGGVVLLLVIVSVVVLLLVCMCFRLGPFKSQVNVRSNMYCAESKPADDSTRFE